MERPLPPPSARTVAAPSRRKKATARSTRPKTSSPMATPGYGWNYENRSGPPLPGPGPPEERSEEHTSELQSQSNLVCRLLLEKKKNNDHGNTHAQRYMRAIINVATILSFHVQLPYPQ